MAGVSIAVNSTLALNRLARVEKVIQQGLPKLQQRVATRTLRRLVIATPKGFTGHTRQSWTILRKLGKGVMVTNTSKVMVFLEHGTQAHGPTSSKALFIPKTRRAAISGWSPELIRGVDYVMAKWVKGIRAMRIVAKERKVAQAYYKKEARKLVAMAVKE